MLWESVESLTFLPSSAIISRAVGVQSYYESFHKLVLGGPAKALEIELTSPAINWKGYALSLRFRLHRFDLHLRQQMRFWGFSSKELNHWRYLTESQRR